jgi:hypothetical protein
MAASAGLATLNPAQLLTAVTKKLGFSISNNLVLYSKVWILESSKKFQKLIYTFRIQILVIFATIQIEVQ